MISWYSIRERYYTFNEITYANCRNIGPALSSSHCKHEFNAQSGGGPLLGALNVVMQEVAHAFWSNIPSYKYA